MFSWEIAHVVQTVLTGLVLLPAFWLFARIYRTPGAKHDHTRRWVDFTKVALGLWIFVYSIYIIVSIITHIYNASYQGGNFETYMAINYLTIISGLFYAIDQVAFFLALFHLGYALTQLRTGAVTDKSPVYRGGQKAALGVSILVTLISFVIFCLRIVFSALTDQRYGISYEKWLKFLKINTAVMALQIAHNGIMTIVAIFITFYAIRARKAAKNTPVSKAASVLRVSAIIWFVTKAWALVEILVWSFGSFREVTQYTGIFNFCLDVLPTFVVLVLLHRLATKEEFGLSRVHYAVDNQAAA